MQLSKSASPITKKAGKKSFNFDWKILFSDWKAIFVVLAFILSVLTLFQVDKVKNLEEWKKLSTLPVFTLKQEVWKKAEKLNPDNYKHLDDFIDKAMAKLRGE